VNDGVRAVAAVRSVRLLMSFAADRACR
jgi:hypothetical protein